jgi:hypothetical protein
MVTVSHYIMNSGLWNSDNRMSELISVNAETWIV